MGLPIGHRSGVPLRTGHISGLNAIPIRHGVPFYSPAPLFHPPTNIHGSADIIFSTSANLSGVNSPVGITGSANIVFGTSGHLVGIPGKVIPPDSERMVSAEDWIKFHATGKLSRYSKMSGVSWMIFYDVKGNLSVAPVQLGYGLLYNWYAVNTGKLAPTGCHVPTSDEWDILRLFVTITEAGGELKEIGTTHWQTPNTGATDNYGFTALPVGYRESPPTNLFDGMGFYAIWWSSTDQGGGLATTLELHYNDDDSWGGPKLYNWGLSVRCLLDDPGS